MRFKNIAVAPILALALLVSPLFAPAFAQETDEAVTAASAWLALVDAEDYTGSYDASSDMLKEQVSSQQWADALGSVQLQLSAIDGTDVDFSNRDLISAERLEDIPELPEGEFVMVRYRTAHSHVNLMELVTLRQEPDAWRVVGYFVAPEEEE
jgi:hypothetical protein